MADQTGIEWAHHTHNPWIGCTNVSPACDHCYAEIWANRFYAGDGLWSGGNRHRTSQANRNKPFKWNREAKRDGVRRRVFCLSLGDFADNQVPEEWRDETWETIAQCPDLDWLILSKRPQNYRKMLPKAAAVQLAGRDWPWPWVWLGTTSENQEEADRRIPELLKVPAAKHFISAEPLLGLLRLRETPSADGEGDWLASGLSGERRGLSLVIVGGESGPDARPMRPAWARSLRDQCAAAHISFHFKQWGDWHPDALLYRDIEGRCPPPNMRIGKKAAGRLLDGRTHDEMPA